MVQRRDGALIQGHGVGFQGVEILVAEAHVGRPEGFLAVVFWKPKLEAGDDFGVHLKGTVVLGAGEAKERAGDSGRVVPERGQLLPVRTVSLKLFKESGHAVLDVNHGRLLHNGEGVEVNKDEA